MPRILRLVALALLSIACASVPRAPAWFGEGPACERRNPDGSRTYCGTALADDAESARNAALANALGHAASEIETEVQAKLELDTSCVAVTADGRSSSRCEESARASTSAQSRRLAFRDVKAEQLAVASEAGRQRAWAVVRVPAGEWRRVVRAARGKTLVAIDCRAGAEACPPSVMDALASGLSACGVAPTGGIVTDVPGVEALVARALAADAGKALLVGIRAADKGASDGLAVAEGSGRWELVETGDAKTLRSAGVPAKTSVAVGAATAREAALRGAVERLSSRSCGLSEARGSLCCAAGE
jgi:hypothetical protein